MQTKPQVDVDALRDKLRSLGYLDAGVDRFVLAGARSGRSVSAIAWQSSIRIGLLAGLLLGVSGTLAALRVPGLIGRVQDALLVGIILASLLGIAVAALSFLTIRLAARFVRPSGGGERVSRRRRLVPAIAGLIVGAVLLGYLTLWWRALDPVTAWRSPTLTWLALAVAVGVSLLLGHATSATARALLVLEPETAEPQPANQLTWRATATLAAVSLAASGLLLFATTRPVPAVPETPLTVVPTGLRLVVVGIDGLDRAFAIQVAQARALPTLTRLLSAPGLPLTREPNSDPVATWATLATGHPPARHGAVGLESRRVAGFEGQIPLSRSRAVATVSAVTDLVRLTQPAVSSGAERREKAFWEVAASAGLRTAVVNWWTTWPAGEQDGIVITNRAALRLDRGGTLDREVAPAPLFARLRDSWPLIRTSAGEAAQRVAKGLAPFAAQPVAQAVELDAWQVGLAAAVDDPNLDLLALYLPGLDIVQVALTSATTDDASSLAARVEALDRMYVQLESWLARLTSTPGRVVVFVSHPGRAGSERGGWLTIDGLGPTSGRARSVARLEDAAPTILALLGLPISAELHGTVLRDLLPEDFLRGHDPRTVPTYGRRHAGAPASPDRAMDDEMRDRLRSLGYVR